MLTNDEIRLLQAQTIMQLNDCDTDGCITAEDWTYENGAASPAYLLAEYRQMTQSQGLNDALRDLAEALGYTDRWGYIGNCEDNPLEVIRRIEML